MHLSADLPQNSFEALTQTVKLMSHLNHWKTTSISAMVPHRPPRKEINFVENQQIHHSNNLFPTQPNNYNSPVNQNRPSSTNGYAHNNAPPDSNTSLLTCHYCKKPGHVIAECRARQNKISSLRGDRTHFNQTQYSPTISNVIINSVLWLLTEENKEVFSDDENEDERRDPGIVVNHVILQEVNHKERQMLDSNINKLYEWLKSGEKPEQVDKNNLEETVYWRTLHRFRVFGKNVFQCYDDSECYDDDL
ncbi:unnamed protein product [Brachionus calyciflorus]|uniref:CCHC-type domain-containing protein n=1 Tax=Brachionus calyciflorus TaxID=104777 RepID=A0A813YA60_9BILA|nr:unnamed protein product [Brachionus calyciflorus]